LKATTGLKQLVEGPDLLYMPGAVDPISARMIEQAGLEAVPCSGLGIAASYVGLPDVSTMGMNEAIARAGVVPRSISMPVMADADTGCDGLPSQTNSMHSFAEAHSLFEMEQVYALERRFLPNEIQQQKNHQKGVS
jgi:2-methylisocitrate lyase-like PEP mutase family enzyme